MRDKAKRDKAKQVYNRKIRAKKLATVYFTVFDSLGKRLSGFQYDEAKARHVFADLLESRPDCHIAPVPKETKLHREGLSKGERPGGAIAKARITKRKAKN